MASFRITPKGPFSLEASTRFLEGFSPAAYERGPHRDHLHLAFSVEGDWDESVGVCVRQTDKAVIGAIWGDADSRAVRRQVERILSLDVDGSSFAEVGERDPIVARLQRSYRGLRPVLFWSPYEAAAWTIIGHRVRITQAARIKQRLAEDLGDEVNVHGSRLCAFPGPQRLGGLHGFPGLFERKIERLRSLGEAATGGLLDAARLRSLPQQDALAELKRLPGIGDFSAELILVRGAGEPDYFSRSEKRLHQAMAEAYGLDSIPDVDELAAIADTWRPYRSWVSVLFRTEVEDQTREIAGG